MKELFETLKAFVTDQAKVQPAEVAFLRSNGGRYYALNGDVQFVETPPPYWRHRLDTLDAVAAFCQNHAGEVSQIWVGERCVHVELEAGSVERMGVMEFKKTQEARELAALIGGRSVSQSAALRLFRVVFAGSEHAAPMVDAIKAIRVTATVDSDEAANRMGKSIAREAVGSRFPEHVDLALPVFDGVEYAATVRVFVGPNLEKPGEVLLEASEIEYNAALRGALDFAASYVGEYAEHCYRGELRFEVAPGEFKGAI